MIEPRGVRNRNPGNLKWGENWQGLVDEKIATDATFCQFTEPVYGIRAMVKLLDNYRDKHGLQTVEDIINRWAPPVENATNIYAEFVASRLGVTVGAHIDTRDTLTMRALVAAIIRFENGTGNLPTISTWYPDAVLDRAIDLARGGGGGVAGGLIGSGAVAGVVAVANGWGNVAAFVFGVALVAGVAWYAFKKLR